MALSLYKALGFFIFFNVMLFTVTSMYNTNRSVEDDFDSYSEFLENYTFSFKENYESTSVDTSNNILESTFGNPIAGMGALWSFIKNGIPCVGGTCDSTGCEPIERLGISVLCFLFAVINFLIIIQVVALIIKGTVL